MVRGEQLINKWEMVSLFKLREPKKKEGNRRQKIILTKVVTNDK